MKNRVPGFKRYFQDLPLTTITTAGICFIVLLLIHIAAISIQQCFDRLSDTGISQQRLSILTVLDQIKYCLSKAEAAEYAYVWTGQAKFLDQYKENIRIVDKQVMELDMRLHGKHRMLADEIRELIRVRSECAEEVIALRKTQGMDVAAAHGTRLGEAEVTKHLEVMVDELGNRADMDFQLRGSELDRGSRQTIAGISMLMVFAMTILIVVIAIVNKYVGARNAAERSLRDAERRFRAVFNQTFQFSGLLSPDGIVLEANQSAVDFAGGNILAVKEKYFWDTSWWSYSTDVQEQLKKAIGKAAKGEMIRFESEVEGPGGRSTVDFSVKPVKEDDVVIYLIAEARDITERVRAEELLSEREARMRAIVDTAPDGIITVNSDGTLESMNGALERLLGYETGELLGKDINTVLPLLLAGGEDGDTSPLRTGERRVFGVGREFYGFRKDGDKVPVEVSLSMINLGNQQILTGIVRDITERKRAEQRVKDFYSTVSHELRTPLTAIRTALGIMENSFMGELTAQARPVVQVASKETDRLIRLINDILDIRKMEAGKLDLKLTKLDPREIVERALDGIKTLSDEAGIRIERDLPWTRRVLADEDRLQQVLTNLVSNAVKWSPVDGVVKISLREVDQKCRFEVTDEGPGIPEDEVDKLFGRFQQLASRDDRARGGTGLGLAIAKAIVEQHGGEIGVELKRGTGSMFWFELPLELKILV
ncbi:MAG: PAS domain S-box protein [Candidatus Melainabacteria bacterium]|nr:PAS domain S-box protein [Candidatus Melainabacteria bacterium]